MDPNRSAITLILSARSAEGARAAVGDNGFTMLHGLLTYTTAVNGQAAAISALEHKKERTTRQRIHKKLPELIRRPLRLSAPARDPAERRLVTRTCSSALSAHSPYKERIKRAHISAHSQEAGQLVDPGAAVILSARIPRSSALATEQRV